MSAQRIESDTALAWPPDRELPELTDPLPEGIAEAIGRRKDMSPFDARSCGASEFFLCLRRQQRPMERGSPEGEA